MHFIDASRTLNESELQVLGKLLTYGLRVPATQQDLPGGQPILVTPRIGTESPWSSKASDIVHVCGLGAVTRVERGTVYFIEATAPLSNADLTKLAAHLHDRMTESIWIDTLAPEGLFHAAPPRGLRHVIWASTAASRWRAPTNNGAWRCQATKSTIWCGHLASWGETPPMSS